MLRGWWIVLVVVLCGGARVQQTAAPRPVCPHDAASRCIAGDHNNSTYQFYANGAVTYKYTDREFFTLKCSASNKLDDPALPRFEPALRVRKVRLIWCWPHAASFEAALLALNVTGLEEPSPEGVSALPTYFIHLELYRDRNYDPKVLAVMKTLRILSFESMTLTSDDLARLPSSLERLQLWDTKIRRVPATALARLPNLRFLRVWDKKPIVVESAGNLSSLIVTSSTITLGSLSLPDSLATLHLSGWASFHPLPWRSCAGLESLVIVRSSIETLSDGWLARCIRLRTLRLEYAMNLRTLPEGVLRGAIALEQVWFMSCALKTLPKGLLNDTTALRVLVLQGNKLHTPSSDLFRVPLSLTTLDLSNNRLNSSVLQLIKVMTSLSELRLEGNTELDACPRARYSENNTIQEWSLLRNLKNLTVLSLARTATSRVCPDWRQLPRLENLDLSKTATRLNYTDLQFNTTGNIKIALSNFTMRREDYEMVAAAQKGPIVTLRLSGPLRCDCELYWFVAALRLPNTRLREAGVRCQNQRTLKNMTLDELICTPLGTCPANCACGMREDLERPGLLLQLDCARAKLQRVPRINARDILHYMGPKPIALDLRLEGNIIDKLTPEDLPLEITALDLRGNALAAINAATVAALVSRSDRHVRLSGNPFNCSCRFAAPTLTAMRAHPDMFLDRTDIFCFDSGRELSLAVLSCEDAITSKPENTTEVVNYISEGVLHSYTTYTPHVPKHTPVPENESEAGSKSWTLVLALVLGVALGAVVMAALGWNLQRWRARRALREQREQAPSSLRFVRQRPNADEWVYDAFVSFAHADEAIVRELVEQLESGPAPLRLCVHYRDWVPGGWIPAQIAASVRMSRRTVAVVSSAFLRSKWARAEFREAYAAALEDTEPRLVLVLLEDPMRLQLDEELRAYVSGNTYVLWSDPWFWRKLRCALPAPCLRPVTEATAANPDIFLPLEATMTSEF